MTPDVVYVVGGPSEHDRSDLRHSLRSLERNLQIGYRDVWVVGDVPAWFTGAKLPLEPLPGKFENQRASLTAYVNFPGAAERFILANDDMYFIEPITGQLPTFHLGKARDFFDAKAANTWHRAGLATAAWMEDLGHGDVLCYEAHTPLLFHRGRLAELLNAYPLGQRLLVGELYAYAGDGGEGSDCGNAKVRPGDDLAAKLAQPMPYLSSNPQTWDGELGAYIRAAFPDKCRFER